MSNEQREPFAVEVFGSGYARNPTRIRVGNDDFEMWMDITDEEESTLAHKLWARALARGEVLGNTDTSELAAVEAVVEEVAAWRDAQNSPPGSLSGAGELSRIIDRHEHAALETVVAAAVNAERERCARLVLNHPHRIGNDAQLVAAIRS